MRVERITIETAGESAQGARHAARGISGGAAPARGMARLAFDIRGHGPATRRNGREIGGGDVRTAERGRADKRFPPE